MLISSSPQRDKHTTFEDPRATTSDPAGSKYSTQEWLDALENARDIALATSTVNGSYSDSSLFNANAVGDSAVSSPADSLSQYGTGPGGGDAGPSNEGGRHLRHTLRKNTDDGSGGGGGLGKKRFSKRQSRSGLAAVF